jgi:anti-sigma factor ChrR (cupin superfamily)
MSPNRHHLDSARLQALAEGGLSSGDSTRARQHLAECSTCRDEFAVWQRLLGQLDGLEALAPSPAFAERVLTKLAEPVRHPATGQLQDYAEGLLGGAVQATIEGHLARCPSCRGEVAAFEALDAMLADLPQLAPAPEFADAVLTAHRIERLQATVPAAPSRATLLGRRVRAVVTSPRHRLAAALGLALAPALLLALVVRAVFSHPLVTPSSLSSFAWLRLRDALGGVGQTLRWVSTEVAHTALPALPQGSLAGALTAGSMLTLAAAWIVYRNVFAHSASEVPRANS